MLGLCVFSVFVLQVVNAAHIGDKEYSSQLDVIDIPSNFTIEPPINAKSIVVERGTNIDANGCVKCSRSYLIGTQRVPFRNAVLLCNQIGMEIASPMSIDEERALERTWIATKPEFNVGNGVWIGGKRCPGCLSDFTWISSGKPVIFRHFLLKQPDNAGNNENCLELVRVSDGYGWNDLNCDVALTFACQTKCCCNN